MTTEWNNSPTISREAWREHARELDRLLAAERAVNAACQRAVDEVDAENAHLRAALHRMRDLGQGMSRTWYLREIDDGLNVPALTHER